MDVSYSCGKRRVDEKAVRRMLRLDYGSGVDKIEAALAALGRRSVFSVSAVEGRELRRLI